MRQRVRLTKPRPSVQQLREWFSYEPTTGTLRWKIDVRNGRGAGYIKYEAGSVVVPKKFVTINDNTLVVTHVVFALSTGRWPSQIIKRKGRKSYTEFIDHKNGNRLDNEWNNLRRATPTQNSQNHKLAISNKSGTSGVHWHVKKYGQPKWQARITVRGTRISLGCFDKKEDAIAARIAAEERYFGEWRRAAL